jgi:hypothetical protein
MAQMVWRVTGIQEQNNARGEPRFVVTLRAIGGEAFGTTSDGPAPQGAAVMEWTPEYFKSKKLAVGDTTTMTLQEQ